METRNIDITELDALIERIKQAQANTLALSPEDLQLVLNCLLSLLTMQTELSSKDITIRKLQKLAGMIRADERLSQLVSAANRPDTPTTSDADSEVDSEEPAPKDKKPRRQNKPQVPTKTEFHALTELQKNMNCLVCGTGTLSKYAPAEFIRITGHSPYEASKHVLERLRCNQCGAYYTAPLSGEAAQDGPPEQKYGYSARAIMAVNKYHMGSPFYRQTGLQDLLHVPISASTIYDQCEYLAGHVVYVYHYFMKLAADARLMEYDDTYNLILSETTAQIADRKTGKVKERTGTYTTGLIATLQDDKRIVLFNTGIGYAAEFIESILRKRSLIDSPVITMSDALNRNKIHVVPTIEALCNAHGRRDFADLIEIFPQEVVWILEHYQKIWINDKATRELTPEQRRDYHKEHSLPVMEAIRQRCQSQLDSEQVEANSNLGLAMRYIIRHYDGLSRFCHVIGAPIDNNRMESMLKIVIRNRKNAYFYKTAKGAEVSDIITSIIATCMQHGVNAFDYLCCLQRYHDAVQQRPQDFMPWNYPLQLEKTMTTA